MIIQNKLALVTGAASGIGAATALRLAQKGARIVALDRDAIGLEQLAAAIESGAGWKPLTYVLDLTDQVAYSEVAINLREQGIQVDILVNNAGILRMGGILQTPLEDWEALFKINLLAFVHGVQLFAPSMVERGQGAVVNVASASGKVGCLPLAAYSALKFSVVGMSQSLHAELRDRGVQVSWICPGLVATNILQSLKAEDPRRSLLAANLQKNGIAPERVAESICRAIEKNKRGVDVGADAHLLAWASRILPDSASIWVSKLGKPRGRASNGFET